jgi:hypothetical protein
MPTLEEVQAEIVKSNEAVTLSMAEIKKELDANKAALADMKKNGDRPEATAAHGKKMEELEKSLDGAQSALTAAQAELVAMKSAQAEQVTRMDELQKALQRTGFGTGEQGDEAWKSVGSLTLDLLEQNREVFERFGAKTMNDAKQLPSLTMKTFGKEPAFQGYSPADIKKALTGTATTNFIQPYQIPGYLPITRRSLRIRDLLPMVRTTARHILYIRQTGFTGQTASAVTSITQTGGVATVTQTAHGYDDFDLIKIAGSTIAAYNGNHRIKVLTANTYTFAIASGAASPATGTITALRMNNYGAAGFVAEGNQKPQTDMYFEERTADVQVIAHHMKTSRQVLDDMPGLRQGIDSDLIYGVLRKEDVALLYASGTGGQTAGLLTDPDIQTYNWSDGKTGDSVADAIRRSRTHVELADFESTGCVLHPTVWEDIELEKGTDGHYMWVNIGQTTGLNPAGETLWRMPLVLTRAIAADTWLTGSFAQAATLYDREQANIRFADQNEDDFIKNLVTILAEERLALAVKRPEAFVKGTFDAAP